MKPRGPDEGSWDRFPPLFLTPFWKKRASLKSTLLYHITLEKPKRQSEKGRISIEVYY